MPAQRQAAAVSKNGTTGLLAWCAVVDAPAIAAVEPRFGAKPPNRVLHEPREVGRESRVKAARVDLTGDARRSRPGHSSGPRKDDRPRSRGECRCDAGNCAPGCP